MWRGSMPTDNALLIVAQSGRALAQAAARAGFGPLVIDHFGDTDTCAAAAAVRTVSAAGSGFAPASTRAAAELLLAGQPSAGLIYGSGLESQAELLGELAAGRELLGNAPDVVRRLSSPGEFFPLLRRLGIPYPETVFDAADARGKDWLLKRAGGCGGGHVRPHCPDERMPSDCYLQRRLRGRTVSALFLADGRSARVIGYSELWHARSLPETPFLYGGAVGLPAVGRRVDETLEAAACQLTAGLGLRGLCGIDAVIDDEQRAFVLDVNPRPPATFELHQGDGNLLADHIAACRGRLPERAVGAGTARAHAVIYARSPVLIPADVCWPEWTGDRPPGGRSIARGEPVCTVFARAAEPAVAVQRVTARVSCLEEELGLREQAA